MVASNEPLFVSIPLPNLHMSFTTDPRFLSQKAKGCTKKVDFAVVQPGLPVVGLLPRSLGWLLP